MIKKILLMSFIGVLTVTGADVGTKESSQYITIKFKTDGEDALPKFKAASLEFYGQDPRVRALATPEEWELLSKWGFTEENIPNLYFILNGTDPAEIKERYYNASTGKLGGEDGVYLEARDVELLGDANFIKELQKIHQRLQEYEERFEKTHLQFDIDLEKTQKLVFPASIGSFFDFHGEEDEGAPWLSDVIAVEGGHEYTVSKAMKYNDSYVCPYGALNDLSHVNLCITKGSMASRDENAH